MLRLVATSDTHFPVDINMIPDGNIFLHAGDLMGRGSEDEWYKNLDWLQRLPHAEKLICVGNHERYVEQYSQYAIADLKAVGVTMIGYPSDPIYRLSNGMTILAMPFVTDLPRWAFNRTEEWIEMYLEELNSWVPDIDIVVTHSPAYGILDHLDNGESVGVHSYRKWFLDRKHNIKWWLSGHLHESYGHIKINNTDFYNVAMCNKNYEQVNKPIILEL